MLSSQFRHTFERCSSFLQWRGSWCTCYSLALTVLALCLQSTFPWCENHERDEYPKYRQQEYTSLYYMTRFRLFSFHTVYLCVQWWRAAQKRHHLFPVFHARTLHLFAKRGYTCGKNQNQQDNSPNRRVFAGLENAYRMVSPYINGWNLVSQAVQWSDWNLCSKFRSSQRTSFVVNRISLLHDSLIAAVHHAIQSSKGNRKLWNIDPKLFLVTQDEQYLSSYEQFSLTP